MICKNTLISALFLKGIAQIFTTFSSKDVRGMKTMTTLDLLHQPGSRELSQVDEAKKLTRHVTISFRSRKHNRLVWDVNVNQTHTHPFWARCITCKTYPSSSNFIPNSVIHNVQLKQENDWNATSNGSNNTSYIANKINYNSQLLS